MLAWLINYLAFALPLLVIALSLVWLGFVLFDRFLGIRIQRDLVDARNPAIGILLGAFLIGSAIGLEGLYFGRHEDPTWTAIGRLATEGLLVLPLMFASIWINDRLILYRFKIMNEIKVDQNLGIACGVAGSCLASGLVIDGVLTGYSATLLDALRDIVLYWLLAQGLMVATVYLDQLVRPYGFHETLEEDENLAVGISLCSFLTGIGFISRAAVIHAGHQIWWQETIVSCGLALAGVAFFVVARRVLSPIFLKNRQNLQEVELRNNFAASCVLSGAHVALSLLISAAIQRPWTF